MNKKILSFFSNPYIITGILTVVVLLSFSLFFPKYEATLTHTEMWSGPCKFYYKDLNNDGLSEKIVTITNTIGNVGYMIYDQYDDMIDQWNFDSQHVKQENQLYFGDMNKNGYEEIYVLSKRNDSVFLNISEPLSSNFETHTVFVDTVSSYKGDFTVYTGPMYVDDIDVDGNLELLFNLNAGYSGNPRSIYCYKLHSKTLLKSPHLTNASTIRAVVDIDGNGRKDIIVDNHSSGNNIDSLYTQRSDYSTWLFALNDQLEFVFDPVEFQVSFSGLNNYPLKYKDKNCLMTLVNSRQSEEIPNKIIITSLSGTILFQKTLPVGRYILFRDPNNHKFLLLNHREGIGQYLDENFNVESTVTIIPYSYLYMIDVDNDGVLEWISHSTFSNEMLLYRSDFTHPVELEFDGGVPSQLKFDKRVTKENKEELYFQVKSRLFVFSYNKNGSYFLNYLIVPLVYILMFLLVWLISKTQRIRIEKKLAIEKEIAQLQIKTLKNQVDPHFVFNAINSMSEMILTDNKLEADRFIGKFSHMMRGTLQNSDKVSCTLQEEIAYVENYIQLQQIRFMNSFEYKIAIQKNVDMNIMVPKHVLYSYVENAIKHGIPNAESGNLNIQVSQNKKLKLIVEDNGGGLENATITELNSTGSGIDIMKRMFQLYTKLYNRKISYSVKNSLDASNNPIGVKVTVSIDI